MTIDLTASIPEITMTCDVCCRDRELFHLIATSTWLCRDCFALVNA